MAYNKTSRKLVLIDKDHYKQGLPTKTVTAKGYKLNGIRDDKGNLTHNQILVMENVFSGGESNNGNFVRDPNNSMQKPIPNGKYDLLEYEKRSDWFKLDAQDESRYDDVHDKTGRDGFRLHKGTLSYGCVTADSNSEGRNEEWNVLMKIINNTTTEDVPKREGKQKYIPWGTRKKYGYLKVYGTDLIPDKVIPKSNENNNGTQNNE